MEIHSGFAEINGARLYYEDAGQGFPIVMVHAGIADHRMWDDQFPVFAQQYRVIRYDNRGYGKSRMVPGPYSLRDDLLKLLQFLGVEQAVVMGCSMGGETVIDFTLEHPDKAAALITVGSGMSGFPYEGDPPPWVMELGTAIQNGDSPMAAEYAARIWVDTPSRTSDQIDPALRAKVIAMSAIAFSTLPGMGEPIPLTPPAYQRLEEVNLPVLAIAGDLDDPSIMDIADLLASAAPRAKKVVMTGTAHLPNMERPDEFNLVVLSFLKSLNL